MFSCLLDPFQVCCFYFSWGFLLPVSGEHSVQHSYTSNYLSIVYSLLDLLMKLNTASPLKSPHWRFGSNNDYKYRISWLSLFWNLLLLLHSCWTLQPISFLKCLSNAFVHNCNSIQSCFFKILVVPTSAVCAALLAVLVNVSSVLQLGIKTWALFKSVGNTQHLFQNITVKKLSLYYMIQIIRRGLWRNTYSKAGACLFWTQQARRILGKPQSGMDSSSCQSWCSGGQKFHDCLIEALGSM